MIAYKTKSVGEDDPYDFLILITVVGNKVTPAVFKTKNVIISLLATPSGIVDISFNLFIPFKPLGVAANPRPLG